MWNPKGTRIVTTSNDGSVRLQFEQTGADGARLDAPREVILGKRETEGPVSALVHLDSQAEHVCVTLSNAYHDDPIAMSLPEIYFLQGPPEGIPAAAAGLIAADSEQIPDLLRDMVLHNAHYRRTAAEFATIWNSKHAPLRAFFGSIRRVGRQNPLW